MTNHLTDQHVHTRRCWFDHREARWVCASNPPVDIRDMIVVHTAMLREFRLAPSAVDRVRDGDRRWATDVDRHLALLCQMLHHHHSAEDELLWPVLRPRLSVRDAAMVDVAESQHAGLDHALDRVVDARQAWVANPDRIRRDELADSLRRLHELLADHTEAEERHLLPLVAHHLTPAEWSALGEAGAESLPKSAMPLVFGMFAYEGDPDVLASMLGSAPLVPRVLVPRIAPRIYARRARQLYGTATP